MRGCVKTSGCSGASSATPYATRRAPTCSTWSTHPADLDPVPPRRRPPGAARAQYPRQHVRSRTVRIVRAFSYFSHLANIAEDQNNIRQMRARSTAAPRPGTLARPCACARRAGAADRALFRKPGQSGADGASDRSPPQSTIDRGWRSQPAGPPRARPAHAGGNRASDEQLRREVLTLCRPICCVEPSSRCWTRSPHAFRL